MNSIKNFNAEAILKDLNSLEFKIHVFDTLGAHIQNFDCFVKSFNSVVNDAKKNTTIAWSQISGRKGETSIKIGYHPRGCYTALIFGNSMIVYPYKGEPQVFYYGTPIPNNTLEIKEIENEDSPEFQRKVRETIRDFFIK